MAIPSKFNITQNQGKLYLESSDSRTKISTHGAFVGKILSWSGKAVKYSDNKYINVENLFKAAYSQRIDSEKTYDTFYKEINQEMKSSSEPVTFHKYLTKLNGIAAKEEEKFKLPQIGEIFNSSIQHETSNTTLSQENLQSQVVQKSTPKPPDVHDASPTEGVAKPKTASEGLDSTKEKETIASAKAAALKLEYENWNLPDFEITLAQLQGILNANAPLDYATLNKKYIEPYIDKIKELRDLCLEKFPDEQIWAFGRDAINRAFLTDEEICSYLKDPGMIKALFALFTVTLDSQYAKANPEQHHPELKNLILVSSQYKMTLPTMIYFGLNDQGPEAFECFPVDNENFIESYLKQKKHPEKTFIPVLQSISQSYRELGLEQSISAPIQQNKGANRYAINKYQEYKNSLIDPVLNYIDAAVKDGKRIHEMVKNSGGWSLEQLQWQSSNVIKNFCKAAEIPYVIPKVVADKMTSFEDIKNTVEVKIPFAEFVEKFSTSHLILDSSVSHHMDRLHLIAALADEEKIQFSDGQYTLKEFYLALIDTIIRDPSPERAIAAEQLYIRFQNIKVREEKRLKAEDS